MGRNKKKSSSDKKVYETSENDSDEDIPDDAHQRLLENIKRFHGKPKIVPATRNEPNAEVSAFNLYTKNKSNSQKPIFRENELIRAIKRKQPKIAQKLDGAKKTKTLLKPLESVHEKKVQRQVGFQNLKNRLNSWNDVVQSNRLADQLKFPLKSKRIEVYDHTDCELFSSFANPTPLEKEIAEVLNSSNVAIEEKNKVEQSKFRLTLKEMIEKRKMFTKVKVQASYKIAKAWRQNKIKSKKYHRILKREKIKQQLKDFESLQKVDPEAAMKQLENLEKNRAQERATLRHRNTGKWAHNQIVKAKYNKESRIALSEQLLKNRELTQKRVEDDSDIESEDLEKVAGECSSKNIKNENNPWIDDTEAYAQFITSYKTFWQDQKNKEEKERTESVTEIVDKSSRENEEEKTTEKNKPVEIINSSDQKKKENKEQTESFAKIINTSDEGKKENPETVAEIVNSSGFWTVTKIPTKTVLENKSKTKQNEPKDFLVTELDVNEIFDSLEYKTQRSLKKKYNEVQDEFKKNEPKTKNKTKKAKQNKPIVQEDNKLLDEHLTSSYVDNEKTNEINVLHIAERAKEDVNINANVNEYIDPNKYLKITPKRLATEVPDIIDGGNEGLDDEEEEGNLKYKMTISEAFAEDDVVAEFQEEKEKIIDDSKPKPIDLSMPGWGSWTGNSIKSNENKKAKREKINKRLLFKIPKAPPRKDANKGHVIINEEKPNKTREHMVSGVPFPFTRVKDYEASIRAPIGRTWLPESAHQQLIAPAIVTKLGTVIEPMDEGELLIRKNEHI